MQIKGASLLVLAFTASLIGQESRQTGSAADASHEKNFVGVVRCSWPTNSDRLVECADGLTVTGDDSSTILLRGIPSAATTATIEIRTAQFLGDATNGSTGTYHNGVWRFDNVAIPTGELQIDVYKTRLLFPSYPTTNHFGPIGFGLPREPSSRDTPSWIVVRSDHPLSITVSPNGSLSPVTFHIDLQFQRWHVDTGGFYAFSWARDQEIVTQAVTQTDPKATPQSKVTALRAGDKTGPVTGVTFFFHPSNYPDFGFEFGMATNGNKPNSWFLGTGGRLRTFGDRTLLTIGAGVAHVSVKQYPGLKEGNTYDTADALLTGRQHYVNKPYVSLGLGISFGGEGSKEKK
jgi:hypothetical protein